MILILICGMILILICDDLMISISCDDNIIMSTKADLCQCVNSHDLLMSMVISFSGYANFGSDIGGYRSGNGTLGRSKELFIRWAQLGAFSPLMENGGNKEHRPWAFDDETLEIYKR